MGEARSRGVPAAAPRDSDVRGALSEIGSAYLLKAAQILELADDPADAAHCYALLTDEARAVTALEVGYNEHLYAILFLSTAPELDSIRYSARFRDLVRRIGFPQPAGDKN